MNLTKKNIQKTSGIHRLGLSIKPIKKHKG